MNCCMPPLVAIHINRSFSLWFSKIFIPKKYWIKLTSPSLKQDRCCWISNVHVMNIDFLFQKIKICFVSLSEHIQLHVICLHFYHFFFCSHFNGIRVCLLTNKTTISNLASTHLCFDSIFLSFYCGKIIFFGHVSVFNCSVQALQCI